MKRRTTLNHRRQPAPAYKLRRLGRDPRSWGEPVACDIPLPLGQAPQSAAEWLAEVEAGIAAALRAGKVAA